MTHVESLTESKTNSPLNNKGNIGLTIPEKNYVFGTLDNNNNNNNILPADNTDLTENNHDTQLNTTPNLHFFSHSEATLCLKIIKAIKQNYQTLFVSLPVYAQDNALANRIGDYIRLPNTKSVVINAAGLNAKQIISEYIKQLSLTETDNIYHEFARLMTDYFKHGLVLHSVIYNAQTLSKQDFDYLYELASLIYEKFPQQRHKPLMRFIFIADKSIIPILRKKTNSHFQQFSVPDLTITECVNALYLYTPPAKRTESFYQTVGTNAEGIRIATAGYAALLRHLLPLPIAPSLADKRNPENYLSVMINKQLDAKYHKEIALKRLILKKGQSLVRPKLYIRMFLGLCLIALIYLVYQNSGFSFF